MVLDGFRPKTMLTARGFTSQTPRFPRCGAFSYFSTNFTGYFTKPRNISLFGIRATDHGEPGRPRGHTHTHVVYSLDLPRGVPHRVLLKFVKTCNPIGLVGFFSNFKRKKNENIELILTTIILPDSSYL